MTHSRGGARHLAHAVPAALALLVCAPLLAGRGFALAGDMVFVPFQPWKAAWYGGDGGIPRAVPSDAVVSVLTHVVPGDLLQKAVLVLLLASAGWGVQRLVRDDLPLVAATVAASAYVWNPFVHQRLAIGHWALLCGYAALPWVVSAARGVGRGGLRPLAVLGVPMVVAAWTSPTGGALTALAALVVVPAAAPSGRRLRSLASALPVLVAAQLAWLLPGLLNAPGIPPDPAGAAGFAARADAPYGLLGSLVTLGGIWKSSIVPSEREWWLPALLVLAVVLGCAAAYLARCRSERGWRTALGALALGLLLGAWLLSTSWGRPITEWLITDVPGGGLVRDTQKWIALWVLVVALGAGEATAVAQARLTRRGLDPRPLAALILVPVLLAPSMVWGLTGFWRLSHYPSEWTSVAERLERAGAADERGVVLPFGLYRRFAWAHERAVLDPAPRFFPGQWIVDDSLALGEVSVAGDTADADAVRRAIAAGTLEPTLRDLGVRWVLVQHGTPGDDRWPGGGAVVHTGKQLTLIDLGPGEPARRTGWAPVFAGADLLVLAAWLAAVSWIASTGARRVYAERRHRLSREELTPS